MKKPILVLALICISSCGFAQLFTKKKIQNLQTMDKKVLSWGYYLGFNSFDYKFTYEEDMPDILVDNNTGFQVGLNGDLRINEHLNLRIEPGVYFNTRNLRFDESYFEGRDFNDSDLVRELRSTYIYLPLLLKISTKRINNFKPFIIGGIATTINLGSNEDNPSDNEGGQFRLKTNANFYEIGFGIDLYLLHFKLTPSIRGVFSFSDEQVKDIAPDSPWTSNINSMQTRAVFISFTFR